jgi:hypothetical protein
MNKICVAWVELRSDVENEKKTALGGLRYTVGPSCSGVPTIIHGLCSYSLDDVVDSTLPAVEGIAGGKTIVNILSSDVIAC